ncbi:hypothetical protein Dimus_034795 [Dionaea muscipula]
MEAARCDIVLSVLPLSGIAGYPKANESFEEIARHSVNNNLLKYSAKGFLLNADICQLCRGMLLQLTNALDKYQVGRSRDKPLPRGAIARHASGAREDGSLLATSARRLAARQLPLVAGLRCSLRPIARIISPGHCRCHLSQSLALSCSRDPASHDMPVGAELLLAARIEFFLCMAGERPHAARCTWSTDDGPFSRNGRVVDRGL